ncbi:MAG: M43 family zinc metalloprotease [Bacteroidia bacterium]
MSRFLLLLFWVSLYLQISGVKAQDRLCGQEALKELLKEKGLQEAQQHNKAGFDAFVRAFESSGTEGVQSNLRIPIVVHVMHLPSETYGNLSNITDEQIFSQIEVLNEDFRRMAGTRGFNNLATGADVEVEFCLATRDPNGNPTTGIVRVPYAESQSFNLGIDRQMKDQSRWPTNRYLNFWIVKNIAGGLLGYTYLPETLLGDTSRPFIDGIVIAARYFGSVDKQPFGQNFFLDGRFAYGRTATHEVGHYLNLYHTWGDGGCEIDDFVDDTPLCSGPYFGCPPSPSRPFQCPNLGRMVENYMDYSDDVCFNVFTQGQKARMRAALQFYPFRASMVNQVNIIATGCNDSSQNFFADSMYKVLGDTQQVQVNRFTMIPLQTRVVNQLGMGFNGSEVRYRLVAQPIGSRLQLDTILRTTGGGYAQLGFRMGRVVGNYQIEASANTARGGLVYFNLHATAESKAYPNPFEEEVVLQFGTGENTELLVTVQNMQGQQVKSYTTQAVNGLVVDLRGFPNGIYIISLSGEGVLERFKVVKQQL